MNFASLVHFLFLEIKSRKRLELFFTGPGLTHEAEPHWQVGHGHGGSQVSNHVGGHGSSPERRLGRARRRGYGGFWAERRPATGSMLRGDLGGGGP